MCAGRRNHCAAGVRRRRIGRRNDRRPRPRRPAAAIRGRGPHPGLPLPPGRTVWPPGRRVAAVGGGGGGRRRSLGLPSGEATDDRIQRHVEFCLNLARRRNTDVHMLFDDSDDSDDPAHRSLEYLALRVIDTGWEGRVTVGHAGALSGERAHAEMVIGRVADADISVCMNGHISLVLRGRHDRGPVRRGITRARELGGGLGGGRQHPRWAGRHRRPLATRSGAQTSLRSRSMPLTYATSRSPTSLRSSSTLCPSTTRGNAPR